jgi:hypothetical protein
MNKFFTLLIVFLLALQTSGQYVNTPSFYYEKGYVFLKDGSVIKGKYIYNNSMDKLRVVSGRNSWVFDASEVDRTSKIRPVQIPPARDTLPEFYTLPPSKWFNFTEIGVLAGPENSQPAPLVFGTSFNRQIKQNLSAGFGVGVEFLKETYMPVTLNLMYKLRNTRVTPFGFLQAGYQLPIDGTKMVYYDVVPDIYYTNSIYRYNPPADLHAKGGFLVNPSVGIMRQSTRGVGFSLAIGYRFHRLYYTGEDDYRLDLEFYRLSVKLGIIIN